MCHIIFYLWNLLWCRPVEVIPLTVCQRCVLVRDIFQMTNDIVIKKNGTQLFLLLPRATYESSWGLESSKKVLSAISGLNSPTTLSRLFQAMQTMKSSLSPKC